MGTERPQARFVKTLPSVELPSHMEEISSRRFVVEPSKGSNLKLKYERVPLPSTFNYWKTNFKTEVRSSSGHPKEAMPWKSEVEMANSVNDLKTSRSMSGRVYPIFETVDARIASALKKFIHNANFKKKVPFEERKAQKEDRILRGKRT